jgi:hypothetical protein
MVTKGIITINNKKYCTCQYDIVARPYNAITDTYSEVWGWVKVDFTGNVVIDGQQAFGANQCFLLQEVAG